MNFEFLLLPAIVATVAQTALGMVWFGKLFGKQWMQYMEFGKLTASEKDEVTKNMPKLYAGQLLVTFIANLMLGLMISNFKGTNGYLVGFVLWLGFVFTSQSTATIWSQTKFKFVPAQIAIATGYQLVSMMISVFLIGLLG